MRTFLEAALGRKNPTSNDARAALAKAEGELAAAPARIAEAEAALEHVAGLTDEEHAEADERLAAARRSKLRLESQVRILRGAVGAAERAEAAAALKADAAAARKAMAGMERLLDRFDEQANALKGTAEEVDKIDAAVAVVNSRIRAALRAGLDAPEPLKTSHELFRSEPDHVEPDRVVVEDVRPAGVYADHGGELVAVGGQGGPTRKVERTIPGRVRRGRSLLPPTYELHLPSTRLGRAPAWPRRA